MFAFESIFRNALAPPMSLEELARISKHENTCISEVEVVAHRRLKKPYQIDLLARCTHCFERDGVSKENDTASLAQREDFFTQSRSTCG